MRSPVDADPSAKTIPLADAGEVIEALTSDTARVILGQLTEAPAPASDLAKALDISIQKATYHLDRLVEVGVLEVIDIWYSERGREMNVYGLANAPLVIVAGSSTDKAAIERTMIATTSGNRKPKDATITDGGIDMKMGDPSRDG